MYFLRPIGMQGPIKIGKSQHPRARLASYSNWSPFPLELIVEIPGGLSLEKQIHDCFADAHSHREWFHATPRLLKFIADIAAGMPVAEAVDLTKPVGSVHSLKLRDAMSRKGTAAETYVL